MAQQDKGNVTSNVTASDDNKVQVGKAKLKSSKVKDAISRTRTMTGSRPDEININPIQEINQAFREAVNDINPDPKHREAVSRSEQDPKKKQLVPRDDRDRKSDDRPYRHQSIVKKIVDEGRKDPWDKIVKAVPKLKGHEERVEKLKDEMKKLSTNKVEEETTTKDVAVWDKPPPKGKSKKLTPSQISRAKARAKAAGRPYPNLVDNMAVSVKEAFDEMNESFREMVEDAFDMEGYIEEDFEPSGMELYEDWGEPLEEAEKSGRKVKLGKPFLTPGGPKKRAVYVKNEKGSVVKVNFGDPNMTIKKSDPERRKSFRARHNCDNPGPRTKARYWSCKAW